jgi:hypothetical protein
LSKKTYKKYRLLKVADKVIFELYQEIITVTKLNDLLAEYLLNPALKLSGSGIPN